MIGWAIMCLVGLPAHTCIFELLVRSEEAEIWYLFSESAHLFKLQSMLVVWFQMIKITINFMFELVVNSVYIFSHVSIQKSCSRPCRLTSVDKKRSGLAANEWNARVYAYWVFPDVMAVFYHMLSRSGVCCRLIWSAGSPSVPYVDHMAPVVVSFKPCCGAH